MKKKYLIIIFFVIFIVVIVGGIAQKNTKDSTKKLTLLERIKNAETFEEITSCSSYTGFNYPETNEEKSIFSNKVKEYIINHKSNINGVYYYNEYFVDGTSGFKNYGEHLSEIIAIYIKNENEIYIIPFENTSEINEANFEDIPNKEENRRYKYDIIEWDAGDGTWNNNRGYSAMSIECVNVINSNHKLTLSYDENNQRIAMLGSFHGQKDKSAYGKYYLPYDGMYYTSNEKSLQYAKNEYNNKKYSIEKKQEEREKQKEEDNKLAKSNPKVGMTSSEVRKSKWGSPDKINKDTYSWGTKEQWVYNKYGYVYLENGIVTSVSER